MRVEGRDLCMNPVNERIPMKAVICYDTMSMRESIVWKAFIVCNHTNGINESSQKSFHIVEIDFKTEENFCSIVSISNKVRQCQGCR